MLIWGRVSTLKWLFSPYQSSIDLPFRASNWSASPWHMDTVYTQSQSFQHAWHLETVLLRKSLVWRLCTMWLWVFQKQGLVALGATCRVCESRFALWGLIYSPDEKLVIRSHRSSESWFWSSTSIFTSIDCDRILKKYNHSSLFTFHQSSFTMSAVFWRCDNCYGENTFVCGKVCQNFPCQARYTQTCHVYAVSVKG